MSHQSSTPRDRLSIAIAEDDADLRFLLAHFVNTLGHQLVCAVEDGEAILAIASERPFDLALVDLDMPLRDGLEVAEELSQSRGIPSILISGHSDLDQIVLEKEPLVTYLKKPISITQLR